MSNADNETALVFVGGCLATPLGMQSTDLQVSEGTITKIGPSLDKTGHSVVDLNGFVLAPGFLDLQCNGAGGIDLATHPERLEEFAHVVVQWGVTTVLPTFVTSPASTYDRALESLRVVRAKDRERQQVLGARIPGLHFEGPFLNPERAGAHRRRHMLPPPDAPHSESREKPCLADGWHASEVSLVTLAPELNGAMLLLRTLTERGIAVSAGHTGATYNEIIQATDEGLCGITHLYNAMSAFHHREPGCVGAAFDDTRLLVGLICDGIHVDPAAVRLAWKCIGASRLFLVTDAIAALGVPPDGVQRLADRDVIIQRTSELRTGCTTDQTVAKNAPSARLPDGTLAGSILSMDEAIRNLISFTGCSLHDALRCATSTPAQLLQRSDLGALTVGNVADLVVLDQSNRVRATFINGFQVFGDPF